MIPEELKYPTGRFKRPAQFTKELLAQYISVIESFPKKLAIEVKDLTDEQLDTPYRPDGWTIRQVVHHCADSHMNSLMRFKLALTEDKPTIKAYIQDRWAELYDNKTMPVEPTLKMLEGIHSRWTYLLKSLTSEQLKKQFIHPEQQRAVALDESMALYAWHCNHHLAHITNLKKIKNW